MTRIALIALANAFSLSVASAVSAEISEDFSLIAKAHRDLARYDVVIDIRYEADKSIAPILAKVKCIDPNRCITAMGAITVLRTPSWLISVDQSRYTMTVAHRTANVADAPSYQDPGKLLSVWLKTGAKLLGGELTANGRHWTFVPASARQPQADLYSDPDTHLLRRLTYQTANRGAGVGRVDISYLWNDPSHLDPADFNETKYIVGQGDTVSPASAYANYSIIRADRH